jgi:hypothetical protein
MTGLEPATNVPPLLTDPGTLCSSQSLTKPPIIALAVSGGEFSIGVGVEGYEDEVMLLWGDGLNDERRFCAEDFRRMGGRVGSKLGDI